MTAGQRGSSERETRDPPLRPAVLVVDDSPANLIRKRRVLQKLDCDVLEAARGSDALAIVAGHELSVVVLDIAMPGMDGFEVAERIHQLPQGRALPIIFCTGSYVDDEHLIQAYETGAVDYIVEPSPDVILLSKVSVFLELSRHRAELRHLLEERTRLHARAEHEAEHDMLTGLPNRRLFQERIVDAVDAASRAGTTVALLYIDIDDFKPVNDRHGHAVGDALLQAIGARMLHAVKSDDTVARLGGDEFAILSSDPGEAGDLTAMVERVLASVTEPYRMDVGEGTAIDLKVGASIGVALYPVDATDPDALVRAADRALYAAKSAGKGRLSRVTREVRGAPPHPR